MSGHVGVLAAAAHALSWFGAGAVMAASGMGTSNGWNQAAWIAILVVLLGSAALLLGVVLGVVRAGPPGLRPGNVPVLGQQPGQHQRQAVDHAEAKVDQAGLL
ncbi:hypothetical protein [Arthrobacter citreus]|uniref:hypothetical protein n=1 Tax=Arthrobacter citreus TaxID=1670 RepID=UPI0036DD1E47